MECKHENFTADCASVQRIVCIFCKKTEREIVLEMKLEMANKCCDEAEQQLHAANSRIAALERVVDELTKHILTTCGFARGQGDGVDWPEQTFGKCDGYQQSKTNDEPHERCKRCPVCYFNEDSALAELEAAP